ncbi:hypothetical protein RJ640_006127 [Escallonia rubra]|uniref:Alpha/beta hydrolase fold-3 domain-containing protein n=1 Tax=Escallonia rubra TaxID=112253 RepID=A0AA88S412_9ASTE|nr:hypothetical protein RJ640_006127 [Escallonia rubra]
MALKESIRLGSTPAAELTVEERNLLSFAYKNLIGSFHAAWRIVSSIKQKDESQKNDDHMALGRDYISKGAIPHRGGFIAESTFSPLYLPIITNPDEKLPLLIYFHGGGFITESTFSPLYHNYLNSVVAKGNTVAVSVEYKLDPKVGVQINETRMALLFKLDSVWGVDSGMRDLRKGVTRKAIA